MWWSEALKSHSDWARSKFCHNDRFICSVGGLGKWGSGRASTQGAIQWENGVQGVTKKTEPCIKYAKYKNSVNIAKWKVHSRLHMAFCHILSKLWQKYSLVFKLLPILGMRPKSHSNMISIFSSGDAHSIRAAITAYWSHFQSVLTPVP